MGRRRIMEEEILTGKDYDDFCENGDWFIDES
jgi:hypothetical protein